MEQIFKECYFKENKNIDTIAKSLETKQSRSRMIIIIFELSFFVFSWKLCQKPEWRENLGRHMSFGSQLECRGFVAI